MIKDIEINKAADQYADPDGCSTHDEEQRIKALIKFLSFRTGAQWALEQSQWVAGCPEDNKHYIFYIEFIMNDKPAYEVITGYVDEENGELYHYNDDWYGASAKEVVRFHMPLPELP